jgi:transposase
MQLDPLSTDIFIFLNRRRTQMKILCWEGDGFGIYHKKLEKGTFELPGSSSDGVGIPITHSQLILILQGITLSKIHYRPRFNQKHAVVKI